jgi:hypothetical protein
MYFGVNTTSGDGFIQTMRNNTATAYNLILNSAGGNVGIGTTSPTAKLTVRGPSISPEFNTTTVANASILISNSDTDYGTFISSLASGVGIVQQRRYASAVYYDLSLNPYGGNVGIGTTSPGTKLDVAGTIRSLVSGGTPIVYLNNGSTQHSIQNESGAFTFYNSGVERMRLNASGNFLVGTTLSVGKIVSKTFSATESAFVGFQDSATTTQHFKLGAYDNGSAAIYGTQLSALTNYAATLATQLAFSTTNASGTLTEYMRLDSSGNLGIGTSGPVAKLDVVGGNGDGIQYRTSTRSIGIGQISSQASLFWGSSTDLTFFAGSELARLTSGGNLGLGTTSPTNTAGFSRQLQISGTTAALTLTSSTGGSNYSLGAGSVGDFGLWNNTTSSYRWYVDSSGNVGIGTSSPLYHVMILRRAGSTITQPLLNLQSQTSGSVDGDSFILYGTQSANWSAGVDQADSNKFRIEPGLTLGGADGLTITTAGNFGIGTTNPVCKLHVAGPGNTTGGNIHMGDNTNGASKWTYLTGAHYNGATNTTGISMIGSYSDSGQNAVVIGGSIYEANPATVIQFWTHTATTHSLGGTERARITSAGDLLVGTTSATYSTAGRGLIELNGSGDSLLAWKRNNAGLFYIHNYSSGIDFWNTESTFIRFGTSGAERVRIDSGGNFLVGTTNTDPVVGNVVGGGISSAGIIRGSATSSPSLGLNRRVDDGDLVHLYQAGALEGTISVSGATVSYNAFAGSHWSQLQDGSKPNILRGTVMESINELCVWSNEQNERLPKSKISDTAGSKKVYGVFMAWDNDWTETNDMYVTAVGAFICRVNGSVTVQEGDLLESNGDGTARVQADDIIRSSTIGKVTSTIKTHQYDDGSYCVPTVLYCG